MNPSVEKRIGPVKEGVSLVGYSAYHQNRRFRLNGTAFLWLCQKPGLTARSHLTAGGQSSDPRFPPSRPGHALPVNRLNKNRTGAPRASVRSVPRNSSEPRVDRKG